MTQMIPAGVGGMPAFIRIRPLTTLD
jgi:hypothetical protein